MSEPPTAETLRLYSDGELPDDEARQVEEQLRQQPRLKARVAFERQLKQRVAQVMRAECPTVPAELTDRVRQALTDGEGLAGAGASRAIAGRVGGEAEPESRAWWRGPNRANFFAVAASLALVAGAVLFGILGPQIDTLRRQRTTNVAGEAAAAVAGEHVKATAGLTTMIEESRFRTRDEAWRGLGSFLDPSARVFDLSDLGYDFVMGSACEVPNCESGCHLFYFRSQGTPGLVSLHVVPDRGQCEVRVDSFGGSLPLDTGVIAQGPECQKDVLMWNHAGYSYLLVVCVSEDVPKVAKRMQEALLGLGSPPRG
jgi:anti-sigma factor RsiW